VKKYRCELILGVTLVALYLAFSAWHSPWQGKLTQAEIDLVPISATPSSPI
jgi:hypothetical protein